MTSDAEANALFWKAYATAILQMIDGGSTAIGDNTRVMIASSNHSAVPGGMAVPQEITNWNIFNLANNLLDPANGITFNPDKASGGYVDALFTYLNTITPPASHANPASIAQLDALKDDLTDAKKAFSDAKAPVMVQFDAANLKAGGTLKFPTWYPENTDEEYNRALREMHRAEGQVDLKRDSVYGPGLDQYNDHKAQLESILDTTCALEPGVNMKASTDDITMNTRFVISAPSPLKVFTVPAYTITGYGTMIDAWMLIDPASQAPAFTSTISAAAGRQFDAKAFGHSESGGSSGFDIGIFSVGGGGGSSTDTSSFQFGQWADDITLTLKVNFAQTMTIDPGEWNFDVQNLVHKMNAVASSSVKTSVWPTQALFASGIGLTVTFGAEAASAFDTFYRHNEEASGGFSIFGFHVGGKDASSVTQVTSKSDWNKDSCTLTISPTQTAHNAQLLAVMGELVTL